VIKRIRTPMYETLVKRYIEIYCKVKASGYDGRQAQLVTKINLQDEIIRMMDEERNKSSEIITAYQNICEDHLLHERAMTIYDLKQCDHAIQAKYIPLVLQ
jgi:hypothetical protein